MTTSLPIIKKLLVNAPIEKVWRAITYKEEMKKWYFNIDQFQLEVGFTFHFYAGDKNVQYLHLCEIKEVIPEKRLSYTWHYENNKGNSLVTFDLEKANENETQLTLTHKGVESFDNDDPAFSRDSFSEGWNHILNTSLKQYLNGIPSGVDIHEYGMNPGQEKFLNYILNKVHADKKDQATILIKELFSKQADGSFDLPYLHDFSTKLNDMLLDEYREEVLQTISEFARDYT